MSFLERQQSRVSPAGGRCGCTLLRRGLPHASRDVRSMGTRNDGIHRLFLSSPSASLRAGLSGTYPPTELGARLRFRFQLRKHNETTLRMYSRPPPFAKCAKDGPPSVLLAPARSRSSKSPLVSPKSRRDKGGHPAVVPPPASTPSNTRSASARLVTCVLLSRTVTIFSVSVLGCTPQDCPRVRPQSWAPRAISINTTTSNRKRLGSRSLHAKVCPEALPINAGGHPQRVPRRAGQATYSRSVGSLNRTVSLMLP